MATAEVKVKKKIRALLDKLGMYYATPMGTGYGNSGVADFLVSAKGRFVAIEAKTIGGRVTALQQDNLARVVASGGAAIVVNEDNLKTLESFLIAVGGSYGRAND